MDTANAYAKDFQALQSIGLANLSVVLRFDLQNRNSFLALLAALEAFPALDSLSLSWASPAHGLPVQTAVEGLFASGAGRIVLCYSIMTHQWPLFKEEIQMLSSHPRRFDIFILAGGPHACASPKRTLEAGQAGFLS